jgi:hypothetical protein
MSDLKESELYNNILIKIKNIKDRLLAIKKYIDDNDNNIMSTSYIQSLNSFSNELNNLEVISKNLYDEYILQLDTNKLDNFDKNKIKNLIIEKKIYDTFTPYMLYLQVLLQNS